MTNDDIKARLDEGSRQFVELRGMIDDVLEALKPIPQMQTDIALAKEDSAATKEIVDAWNAVKTGGKFVRWAAPLLGGAGMMWGAIKLGLARFFG